MQRNDERYRCLRKIRLKNGRREESAIARLNFNPLSIRFLKIETLDAISAIATLSGSPPATISVSGAEKTLRDVWYTLYRYRDYGWPCNSGNKYSSISFPLPWKRAQGSRRNVTKITKTTRSIPPSWASWAKSGRPGHILVAPKSWDLNFRDIYIYTRRAEVREARTGDPERGRYNVFSFGVYLPFMRRDTLHVVHIEHRIPPRNIY